MQNKSINLFFATKSRGVQRTHPSPRGLRSIFVINSRDLSCKSIVFSSKRNPKICTHLAISTNRNGVSMGCAELDASDLMGYPWGHLFMTSAPRRGGGDAKANKVREVA